VVFQERFEPSTKPTFDFSLQQLKKQLIATKLLNKSLNTFYRSTFYRAMDLSFPYLAGRIWDGHVDGRFLIFSLLRCQHPYFH
jgi:hypothetical protein